MDEKKDSVETASQECSSVCSRRRNFLLVSASSAAAASLYSGSSSAGEFSGATASFKFPRLRVAALSELRSGQSVAFNYPLNEQPNMLVKLGKPAQGGIGVDQDIVAFSVLCPHMGGSLRGRYQHEHGALGPCPLHFSTFDLTRAGVPVHASATQNLPQVTLELLDDTIYAVGMTGLIYGYRDNLADGSLPEESEFIDIKAVPGETKSG